MSDIYSVKYGGKWYHSYAQLASTHNINPKTLYSRLKRGWTLDEALQGKSIEAKPSKINNVKESKCIIFRGKSYKSYKELAKDYGINYQTFQHRRHKKWSLEDCVDYEVADHRFKKKEPIIFEGKEYKSYKELAKHYNVNYKSFMTRLYIGYSLKDCLYVNSDTYIEALQPNNKLNNAKPIDYCGKHYESILEFCNAYNLNYKRVCSQLRAGHTPDECVNGIQNKECVFIVILKSNNSILELYHNQVDAAACARYYKEELMWDTVVIKRDILYAFRK